MHSWSSDTVAAIYMHAEVEVGEFRGAAGVWGKAASCHTPLQALHTEDDVVWVCSLLTGGIWSWNPSACYGSLLLEKGVLL